MCGITKIPLKVKKKVFAKGTLWSNVQSSIWSKMGLPKMSNYYFKRIVSITKLDQSWLISFLLWSFHWVRRCRANRRLSALHWLRWFPWGPPNCGTGLSSGCWHTCTPTHVMHPVSNWANNKWKHRAQACSLRLWRGLGGGAEGQLLSQSDLIQPGVQSQHSN